MIFMTEIHKIELKIVHSDHLLHRSKPHPPSMIKQSNIFAISFYLGQHCQTCKVHEGCTGANVIDIKK